MNDDARTESYGDSYRNRIPPKKPKEKPDELPINLGQLVKWLYSLREDAERHGGQLWQDKPRIIIPKGDVIAYGWHNAPRLHRRHSGQTMYKGRLEIGVLYTRDDKGVYMILGCEEGATKGPLGARFWYSAPLGHWDTHGATVFGWYSKPHWWTRDVYVQITPSERPRFARLGE